MKLADAQVEVESNIEFDETHEMNIDASAVPLILKNLISMYSNPYRAVLREYTSNAWDAHKKHDIQRPVEVNLPDRMAPNLIVRDFGMGLSRDELKGFGQFGTSSKRDSNEYTGGFGLGSKSGLAVSSQFTVSSIKNGVRNTIIIARDESNRPIMNFLAEVETDEPSGTTVTIPIRDVASFGDLTDFFVGWAPGSILIDDEAPSRSVYNTDQFQVLGDNYGWTDKSNTASGRDHLRVMINQVYYILEYKKLGVTFKQHNILKYCILKLDNGTVEIAPNREDLIYNARTKAAVEDRVSKVLSLALRRRLEQVKSASNIREALRAIDELKGEGFPIEDIKYANKRLALPGRALGGNKVPDPMVTWATPEPDHRAATGWRIHKSYRNLSHHTPWRFGAHKKFILIHSAAPAEMNRGTHRTYHPDVASIADWITLQPNADYAGAWEIAMTDLPLEKINSIYRHLADIIVPASDVQVAGKAGRSARAMAAKSRQTVKAKTTKLKLLTGTYQGTAETEEASAEDISKTYSQVVFLRNQATGLEGEARSIYTTKKYYVGTRYVCIRNAMSEAKAVFILLAKNDKVDDLIPLLPPVVTLDAIVARSIMDSYSVPSMVERIAASDRANNEFAAATELNETHIAGIKRKETREWIKAMQDHKDTAGQLRRSFSWMSSMSTEVQAALTTGTQADLPPLEPSPSRRYPLLPNLNSWRVGGNKVVDYINLCDRDLNRKAKKRRKRTAVAA